MTKKDDTHAAREMTEKEKAVAKMLPQTDAERALQVEVEKLEGEILELEAKDREAALLEKIKGLKRKATAKAGHLLRFATVPPGPVRVRASRIGFYDNQRYREGDVFTVDKSELGDWMEVVPAETPARVTTGRQDLRKKHDEAVSMASPAPLAVPESTGDMDVLTGG